jgi:hypothetical protein
MTWWSGTTTTGNRKPPVKLRSFSGAVQSGGSAVKFHLRSAQKCTGRITGQTASTYAVTAVKPQAQVAPPTSAYGASACCGASSPIVSQSAL